MDNILVEIYLPAARTSYDVYIPKKRKLHEVITLLSGTFTGLLSGGQITTTDETVICDKLSGEILDINMTAEELGLKNGSKLMFI